MSTQNTKCVMIIDENLPIGVAANTAALLGITLGKRGPWVVGADLADCTGRLHAGIIEFPIPVLKASPEKLRELWRRLNEPEYATLTVADFTDLAQGCKTYPEFQEKMAQSPEDSFRYMGIAICGAKKTVDRLTVSLPLLR